MIVAEERRDKSMEVVDYVQTTYKQLQTKSIARNLNVHIVRSPCLMLLVKIVQLTRLEAALATNV